MYDLKLKQMECFLEVAESLNLTSSAKKLFISQPLASKWIHSLEEELDMQLFRREKSGLELTEEGRYLKEKWIPVLKELRESVVNAHLLKESTERVLRVGCLEMYQYGDYLQEMLSRYSEIYPNVRVEVESYGPRELADRLMSKDLDVILHTTMDLKHNEDFFWVPIKKVKFCIALSKDHPLSLREEVNLSDLQDQVIYCLNGIESPTSQKRILRQCKKAGFEPKEIRGVASFSSIAVNLIYQKGGALVPEDCIISYKDQMKLFYTDDFSVEEYVALVIRSESAGDSAKRFAEFVSNYVKEKELM